MDFNKLVNDFNIQVALIALVCIGVAGIIAIPIARLITQPLIELVDANHNLAKGELDVRVSLMEEVKLRCLAVHSTAWSKH